MARRLRSDASTVMLSRRSPLIGVLLPDLSNPFFSNVAASAVEELRKAGYLATIVCSEENAGRERALVRELTVLGADGLLIAPVGPDYEHLEALQADDFPFVLLDRVIDELGCDWVAVENLMAACQLCETLLSHGAQRIGFIGGNPQISTRRQRLEGYRAALRRQRIPFSKDLIFLGDSSERTGQQGVEQFLKLDDSPDAIFCSNNKIFAGCLERLAGAPRVPWAHMPVACFDEVPYVAHLGRPVVVIAQPEAEIGRKAAALLLERIRKAPGTRTSKPYQQTLLDVEQKTYGF
jgi:LacI family transcriptional regulator